MKPPRLLVVTVALLQLASFCNKGDDIVEPTNDENNVSTKINVTNQSAQVSIKNKIEITIPQGALSGDATISIKTLDPSTLPKLDNASLLESFEVTCSGGSTFSKDLEIKIKYDPSKGEKSKLGNGASYYAESLAKWIPFQDVTVDSVNSTIIIKTNHLCKLARTSYSYVVLGYTDWASSSHFTAYWKEPGVLTNTEYNSPYKTSNVGSDPHYIQDMLYYLEQCWTKFKSQDLYLPSGKINVYVRNTGDDDGETSFLGNISINHRISDGDGMTKEEKLPSVCAHELLHYVQDYYYMQLFSHYTILWWLEATATLGDRIVWPSNSKFESHEHGNHLKNIMHNSWDTNSGNRPDYYTEGCFLTYLSAYRNGAKVNIPLLLKNCGSNTDVSYIRTIIDANLKTLGSAGIGTEYANYIKWAVDKQGPIKIENIPISRGTNLPYVLPVHVPITEATNTVNASFPRLSVRSIKIGHDTSQDPQGQKEKEITIKALEIPEDVSAYVYVMTKDNTTYVKELKNSDQSILRLGKGSNWIEVVLINKSKDDTKSIKVEVKSKVVDDILEILRKCNTVTVSVTGEHNVGKLTDNTITIFYPRTSVTQATPFDWNGLNFSQVKNLNYTTMYQMQETQEVYGTVSKDGKVLEKITVKETKNEKYSDGKLRTSEITEISFINLSGDGITPIYSITGVSCPYHIAFLKYQLIDYTYPTPTLMKNYTSTNWNSTSKVAAVFEAK